MPVGNTWVRCKDKLHWLCCSSISNDLAIICLRFELFWHWQTGVLRQSHASGPWSNVHVFNERNSKDAVLQCTRLQSNAAIAIKSTIYIHSLELMSLYVYIDECRIICRKIVPHKICQWNTLATLNKTDQVSAETSNFVGNLPCLCSFMSFAQMFLHQPERWQNLLVARRGINILNNGEHHPYMKAYTLTVYFLA